MPKISVVIPVYNVEKYLELCLDSCIQQSLLSIEIIVIDDGSTDTSPDIIDRYAAKYDSVIRAFHKPNSGLSDARNFGIDLAVGDYVAFVDSDDWIESTMLEEMYEKAISTDSDVVVCGGIKFYPNDTTKSTVMGIRGDLNDFNHSVAEKPQILFASRSYAWNKIYRRHLFSKNRHSFPSGQWYEDSAIIYNVLADANRVACVPKNFYHYLANRDGAITNSISPRIFDIFKSCDSILYNFKADITASEDYCNEIEKIIRSHLFARYSALHKGSNRKLYIAYINRVFIYLDTHFTGWRKRNCCNENPLLFHLYTNKLLTFLYLNTPQWFIAALQLSIDPISCIYKVLKVKLSTGFRK